MIVVDTNVIAYLLIPGTHTAKAQRLFQKDSEWAAPLLWRSEFRNVLALYIRKHNLPLDLARQLAREAETLMQGGEYEVASEQVLALTASSRCSAYDCEFIALARTLDIDLVTSDTGVLKQFPDTAVSLANF